MPVSEGTTITIRKPDDWHLHVRDGKSIESVIGHSVDRFARAIIMPNLKPPVTTVELAGAYRDRIFSALQNLNLGAAAFIPLMTLYLTDRTSIEDVENAFHSESVVGFKLYPAGATTNSDMGVSSVEKLYPIFEKMQERDVILLVHAEVNDPQVDIFDREKVFIDRHLNQIAQKFPALRIIMEHITTKDGVQFVRDGREKLAGTITPQHLLLNRNAIFQGGLRPHHFCLPVLKREEHREEIVKTVTAGNPRFFAGTDSAPHAITDKESDCGCAGVFNAMGAVELYAEVFDDNDALDHFENFVSVNGARFYGLPINESRITLTKNAWDVPESIPFHKGDVENKLVPFRAGGSIRWQIVN